MLIILINKYLLSDRYNEIYKYLYEKCDDNIGYIFIDIFADIIIRYHMIIKRLLYLDIQALYLGIYHYNNRIYMEIIISADYKISIEYDIDKIIHKLQYYDDDDYTIISLKTNKYIQENDIIKNINKRIEDIKLYNKYII